MAVTPKETMPETPITPSATSGASHGSSVIAAHHITELFDRLDKVEKGNKSLADETKDLKSGQQAILVSIDSLQDIIGRLVDTGTLRELPTPVASPARQQNQYQAREYSRFHRREGKDVDTGGTAENLISDPGDTLSPDLQDSGGFRPPAVESFTRKLEIPVFEGINAFAWLSKVERFIRMGNYTEQQKLDLVAVSLDGVAIGWFNSELNSEPFRTWDDFKDRLLLRFGNVYSRGPSQNLCYLTQTGPVASYIAQFEDLSSQVNTLDRRTLEGIFLNGLTPSLRVVVLMMMPNSLSEMRAFALTLEGGALTELLQEKLQNKNRATRPSSHSDNDISLIKHGRRGKSQTQLHPDLQTQLRHQ